MGIKEIKIRNDFNNKLLKRRELLFSLEYEGSTPSRQDMKSSVVDKFNLKAENTVIVKAESLHGSDTAEVLVHEYADKEAMKMAQPHLFARPHKSKKAAAGGDAGAAAPAAEAKKEEPKAEEAK